MHAGEISERNRRTARAISNATVPPVIAVLTFALINYSAWSGLPFVALTLLTTLFATVVPLSILAVGARRNYTYDFDIPSRVERGHPLLIAAASYCFGAAVLLLIRAPPLTTVVMVGYGAGTLVIFVINLWWKISIHTMGIAGPTAVLIVAFGAWGLLLGLLLPPVMWSRVYLKKHTVAQTLAGAFLGFVPTALALWLLHIHNPLW